MNDDKILDKILTKVVDIDERLNDFVTKDDLSQNTSQILGQVDRFVKLH